MEELRELTAGQKAVVEAYLANYEPSDYYDPDAHVLVDTADDGDGHHVQFRREYALRLSRRARI
ncbi:MAG: hypothetical protein K2G67_02930 [Muribaculaceae bacterium]|nr:hypothetical protein [Muribaculaceae bacterium]